MSDVPQGYKQTEVGVIPEDWEVQTGEQITALIGKGGSPRWQGFEYSNGGMLFVTSENVRDGFLDIREPKYLPLAFHEKLQRTKLQKHDILVNLVGASIGRSCLVQQDLGEANVNQAVAVFRVKDEHSSAFLASCFQAPTTIKRILEMQVDAARPNISLGNLRRFLLPLPPLPEQRAIAEALSDVDELLGGLDRLIAKKRDIKQAAMQQLLTGQTRLPGFHGEWVVKTFGEVALPRREKIDPRRTGGHDFCVELEHIKSGSGQLLGSTSTGNQSSLKSVFRPGDVLFGKLRAYLRKYWKATRSGVCSTEVWVLVPKDEAVIPEFLFQIIQTDDFIDAASNSFGTHMPRSDWTVVKNHELRIPPLPEQTAIAEVLTEMDAELAALERRRDKTRALKQAMMQELLTGRTRLISPEETHA